MCVCGGGGGGEGGRGNRNRWTSTNHQNDVASPGPCPFLAPSLLTASMTNCLFFSLS